MTVVQCSNCGRPFERPEQNGKGGRPRTRCDECAPGRDRKSAERAERYRRDEDYRRRMLEQQLRRRRAEQAREAADDWLGRHGVCNCGIHYLEVPLDEAHRCPRPLLPDPASSVWQDVPGDVLAALRGPGVGQEPLFDPDDVARAA